MNSIKRIVRVDRTVLRLNLSNGKASCKTFSLVIFRYQNSFLGVLKLNYKKSDQCQQIQQTMQHNILVLLLPNLLYHKVLFGG